MKPLKIAVVIPKYGLSGGAEGFAAQLTGLLAKRREFDIHVLANRWRAADAAVTFHKVPVVSFPRWLEPLSFAWFVSRIVEREGFDLVHSHERIFEMDILSFHGIPHMTWRRYVRGKAPGLFDLATAWVEKRGITNPRLKMIMPVSSLVAEELSRLYDLPGDIIRPAHPGVSLERFDGRDRKRCRVEIRSMYGLPEKDIVVLFVGMNFEIKRLDLVIRGLAGLKGSLAGGRTPRLLVVGKGDERRYRRLAEDCGVADCVRFAGEQRDVVPYYLAADILAMPSVYDTFGMVVLEAMAAGLPVIISERVGARDVVKPGVHGYVLPENAGPAEMRRALGTLADDDTRAKMSAECRRNAERLSWERLADDVARLYLDVCGEKK